VVLENDFVARGGGVPGAAYSTGRGERSVMLRTLLLCSCQYVLVLVLCWFCESAGPELVAKSGAVHPGGVAEFVLRIKRRWCVPRFPFFSSPPLEASEGTPNLFPLKGSLLIYYKSESAIYLSHSSTSTGWSNLLTALSPTSSS
jgi:hypothetical protein